MSLARLSIGFAALAATLFGAALQPGAAHAVDQVGYAAQSFAGFGAEAAGGAVTGQKPESKLWYHDGKWWAAMVSTTAGGAHHIHRLDATTWTDTGVLVDARVTSREDVLQTSTALYIVSRAAAGGGSSALHRYSYAAGAYTLDAGFPVDIPGSGAETTTIARDGTGRLWITYVEANQVYVAHSQASDTSWTGPIALPGGSNLDPDDIAAIISFTDSTGPAVGVMWSNQVEGEQRFAVHRDGTLDTTWTLETALSGPREADDHINLKEYAGRVFAVVKTSLDDIGPMGTQVKLLVRSTEGSWSQYPVAQISEDTTRPITLLQIDPLERKLFVFMTMGVGASARGIAYKSTSVGSINFPSARTVFIQGPADEPINDATSTKQNLSPATGIVVMASDGTRYWWNRIGPAGPTAVQLRSFRATASAAGTVLRWRTGSEAAVLGFNVYREVAGKRRRLNRALIHARGGAAGAVYRLVSPAAGRAGLYRLQVVDLDGSRSWGGSVLVSAR